MDCDKGSLVGKIKTAHKQNKIRNSFTTLHCQAAVHPSPGQQGPITCSCDLGRPMPSVQMFPFSFSPQLYTQTMTPFGVGHLSLVRWGQLSQLWHLSDSCAPPASSLVGWGERQKRPWLWINPTQNNKNILHHQDCFQLRSKTQHHIIYCKEN